MSSVTFVNHACLLIRAQEECLLVDPWFSDTVFNNSWKLIRDTNLNRVPFEELTGILISHEHPDHLHFPSLRLIRERSKKDLTLYFPKRNNDNVRHVIEKMGYHYQEIVVNHQEYRLNSSIAFRYFSIQDSDHTIVFNLDDRILVNQNDHYTDPKVVQHICSLYPHIDILATQFSLAGYYANDDDVMNLQLRGHQWHIERVLTYFAAFQPRCVLPFASFVYFCKEYNAYLNDYIVTPQNIYDAIGHEKTQICFYGDEILWNNWDERNPKNLHKWQEIQSTQKEITPYHSVELQLIVDAFERTFEKVPPSIRYSPEIKGQKPFVIGFKDCPQKGFLINMQDGRTRLVDNVPFEALDMSVPSEELLFAFSYPWGFDTLNITATMNRYTERSWLFTRIFNGLYKK